MVRYADRADPGAGVRVGVRTDGGVVPVGSTMAELLALPLAQLRARVTAAAANPPTVPPERVVALPPLDGRMEVWAAGVTYERSRDARMAESSQQDIYEKVYDAERPELFFKAPAWRVVTDGEPVAVRADSGLDVPEPELAVLVNALGEIVGYTVCNDMSSRSIEGANPLYLPQAKVYAGSCAVAPGIRPVWEVDAAGLAIELRVLRAGAVAWSGRTSTARLHRPLPDLVDWLFRGQQYPDGVLLATGTGIIPELSFTLAGGDRVEIDIAGVGSLANPVVAGRDGFDFLAHADPLARQARR